ncbi:MAG: XRE family transcriptional regulator [Candidatus Syntrophonatronum acetioxidans]|uniref:XRE family transcriptional regulator n=1 Tax=Candidatus Syntrophonatronum acetioxidans TaxID=1795816 RepID=A0A424YF22_9FIRM|nr:MAG: XRE family transcriptional regulator [Candidatus Syntrophonatronum acetioxidans]
MSLFMGKRIRGLRRLKRFTQQSLSEKLGISVSMLSNIERGKKYPSHDLIKKIAENLQVPLEELFVLPEYELEEKKEVNINTNLG